MKLRQNVGILRAHCRMLMIDGLWMTGNGRYAAYDFETQTFDFDYLNMAYSAMLSRNEAKIRREQLFRLTNVGDNGIRFPMAEDEARRLQQTAACTDAIYRVLIVADQPSGEGAKPGLPISARVAEIVVLRAGSDPQVEVATSTLARIAIAPVSKVIAADTANSSGAATPGSYDILDVRIHQSFGSIFPDLKETFRPETVLYGRRENWMELQNLLGNITLMKSFAESTILVRHGGSDSLTIFA